MENNTQAPNDAQPQSQFRVLTLQLRDQYRVVEENLSKIVSAESTSTSLESLEHINGLLAQVKDTESVLQPVREQMKAAGLSTPEDLLPVINETIAMVSSLLPKFGKLEKAAVEQRDSLAPQISAGVRAAQMQSAYSRRSS